MVRPSVRPSVLLLLLLLREKVGDAHFGITLATCPTIHAKVCEAGEKKMMMMTRVCVFFSLRFQIVNHIRVMTSSSSVSIWWGVYSR